MKSETNPEGEDFAGLLAPKLKRICYVLMSFPQLSETFIVEEARSLQDCGVEVSIVALKRGDLELMHPSAQELISASRVRYVTDITRAQSLTALLHLAARKPFNTLRMLAKALRAHDRWRYFQALPFAADYLMTHGEYIHAHFADDNLVFAAAISEWAGAPYGFTVHGYDVRDDPIPPARFKSLAEGARAIVTVSENYKRLLAEKYAFRPERIYVAYNGIRFEKFRPSPKRPASGLLRLISVGRLVHIKGHDILLDALSEVSRRGHDVQLQIVGDGRLRGKLEAQVRRLGMERRTEFLGALSQEEVIAHLNASDILVMPSRDESFGVACVEAMAMELPVIASRVGGLPEVVLDGETGLLFDPGEATQLADAIVFLLTHPEDRAAMGQKGREVALAKFALNEVVHGFLLFLRNSESCR